MSLNRSLCCIFLILFISPLDVFARDDSTSFSLAWVGMSMDYREYDGGVIQDSEKAELADIYGYDMGYHFVFNKDEISSQNIDVDFMMLSGNTVYKGATLGSNDTYGSYIGSTLNKIIQASIGYKYVYKYNSILDFKTGLGLGYYVWDRQLSSDQEELYEWYTARPMLGLGVTLDRFYIGAKFEYQYGFHSTISSSNPSVNLNLGGVDIYKLTIPITYAFSKNIDIFAKSIFIRQEIQESNHANIIVSNQTYEIMEPDSTSFNALVKIGISLKY